MNDMQKVMRKVLNARNFIYLSIYLFITGCATTRSNRDSSTLYYQEKHSSKSGFSSIIINSFYDDKYKDKILALVTVNGVCILGKYENENILPIEIKTIPNNKYKIEISSPGLLPLKIKKLRIKKGDSIVINAYLKEDTRPIVD
ncbi:hypothetical protein [uncultured Tenacibaculum sp.]|uniref:hypothetical protein n=1 Tax=uncultured Tenacibaculum sp. TaxID=174713 RepID=UPI0026283771|nr:hypothetical protein [uncultured Tenacibaculum sp.]